MHADPLEIELILLNVLRNSAQVLQNRKDGFVTVSVDTQGDCAVLTLSDNGEAVDDALLERLSQPLTSLKEEGLGIGLSLCRSIAERHGGHMAFERNLPCGLTVRLFLPLPEERGHA